MKVKDLIDELQKLDRDTEVYLGNIDIPHISEQFSLERYLHGQEEAVVLEHGTLQSVDNPHHSYDISNDCRFLRGAYRETFIINRPKQDRDSGYLIFSRRNWD